VLSSFPDFGDAVPQFWCWYTVQLFFGFPVGSLRIPAQCQIDQLSLIMLLLVAMSFLIRLQH
jgi:hypothetical protein